MDETAKTGQDLDDVLIDLSEERQRLERFANMVRTYSFGLGDNLIKESMRFRYDQMEQMYQTRLNEFLSQRGQTSATRTRPEPPGMDTSYLRGEGSLTVNPEGYGVPDTETASGLLFVE